MDTEQVQYGVARRRPTEVFAREATPEDEQPIRMRVGGEIFELFGTLQAYAPIWPKYMMVRDGDATEEYPMTKGLFTVNYEWVEE
jgi:hypothetical protein